MSWLFEMPLSTGSRDNRRSGTPARAHACVAARSRASTPGRRPTAQVIRVTGATISRIPRGVTATGVVDAESGAALSYTEFTERAER